MIEVHVTNKTELIQAFKNSVGEVEDTIIHLGHTRYRLRGGRGLINRDGIIRGLKAMPYKVFLVR